MARIAVLQHFWCENAGVFEPALQRLGHSVENVELFNGSAVPGKRDFDAWIVMGGPMNVDETDRYAFLGPERALLADLIAEDRPVLGICLGSQLIARAAGAKVYPKRPKEIGLFEISLLPAAATDPLLCLFDDPQEVFQWHGDTFDLPARAVHLARSSRFENQAFRLGRRVYAFQFHLESTGKMIDDLSRACARELMELPAGEGFEQYRPRFQQALAAQNRLADKVIESWAGLFD
ncbi:MAG TPA: type 1 glutamine amidotransferase [Phycisphaerae bacterium]|nr:type 1 glutamine amidotransferase [Phycisphaerae bacterium]HRR86670.1 type 1 glutamine amidotransferase [Phycisphaerae bacterium]